MFGVCCHLDLIYMVILDQLDAIRNQLVCDHQTKH